MDEWQYELAERTESKAKELRIAQIERENAPQSHPDFDGKHCISCGEAIPSARLAIGKIRCVDCQSIIEMKDRR